MSDRAPTGSVYYVVGNHDRAADIRQYLEIGPCEYLDESGGLLTYRFDVRGYRFLVLDARAPDETDPHGLFSERQLEIVRSEVAGGGPPLSVFLHFPVLPVDAKWIDDNALVVNGDALHEALLPARDRLRGVFYGHIHMPSLTYRDGILYSSSSSAFANFVSWPGDPRLSIADDPPGYGFAHLTPRDTVVRYHTFSRPVETSRP
jgi:3',5'-cyclic-AMP phosphodiesterase